MTVELLHSTPLWVNAHGARTCWDSGDKSDTTDFKCSECGTEFTNYKGLDTCPACQSEYTYYEVHCGQKDMELIDRVGNKFRHASILEHVSYNFHIKGISRALLQELARHRMASLSVKSTRYTLKELKSEVNLYSLYHDVSKYEIGLYDTDFWKVCSKYLVASGEEAVDWSSCASLMRLQEVLLKGISNDRAKYCMPEAYKTELTWSINMRSLQNFISLRSDKSALWEIRDLANIVYANLPEEHRYLYINHIKGAE